MYTWQIRSQILNLGQNILHIQIECPVSDLTTRKMCQSRVPWVLKDLFYCQILNWTFWSVQCTPRAWDTTLRHDIVDTIIILSQFWGDKRLTIHLKMLQPIWLNFNMKSGWCFTCPRFAAQMPKSGSLGQSIIFTALSHYLVKTQKKMSYKNTIRYN